jgi:hypothetical protein
VDTLQYFRIDVPEDAAVIKLMVDQLQGQSPYSSTVLRTDLLIIVI